MNNIFSLWFIPLMTLWFLPIISAVAIPPPPKQTVFIAAAADLGPCLEAMTERFKKDFPDAIIKVSLGSSGSLFTQIKEGGPYDIFLSADARYPKQLIDQKLADAGSLKVYAIGKLVLWTKRKDLKLDKDLKVLNDPSVKKIAIANPDVAPYGRAAKETLQSLHLWETLSPRLVIGENISQAAEFVETENADLGFVSLSLINQSKDPKGSSIEVPENYYHPIQQALILTNAGAENQIATLYVTFLESAVAKPIFQKFGFTIPEQ